MLGISSIMLLFDAGAYIFPGNIDSFSIVMTRICNFFVFFLQLILLVYGVKLTLFWSKVMAIISAGKSNIQHTFFQRSQQVSLSWICLPRQCTILMRTIIIIAMRDGISIQRLPWPLWFLRLDWSGSIGSIWIRVFWPESFAMSYCRWSLSWCNCLSEENAQTIFYMVKNDIENEFFQPIAVSDTIAQDLELRALFDPQLSSAGEDNWRGRGNLRFYSKGIWIQDAFCDLWCYRKLLYVQRTEQNHWSIQWPGWQLVSGIFESRHRSWTERWYRQG